MARPRKSANELKLAGTFDRGYNRKNWNTETLFVVGDKPAPNNYLQRTKVAWHQFMKAKAAQGVLSEEDMSMVRLMFDALDDVYRIQDEIDAFYKRPTLRRDLTDEDKRQHLKDMVQIRKNHETSFAFFACKFGLSPAERSKLTIPEKKDESPMLALISKVRKEG